MTAMLPLMVAALLLFAHGTAAQPAKTVLVLHSNNRLAPGNIAADAGIREEIARGNSGPVQVFAEFLDQPAFGGEAYERTMTTYLGEKYASRPPSAIVAVSDPAFDFLLRHRAELFGSSPIVHLGVSKAHLQSMPPLPAGVAGVPIEYDFSGTIAQALRWHPAARRLVIVTGASERDRGWEARLRREAPNVAGSVDVEFLAALPTAAVVKRLRDLDSHAVVFTPGYYEDGDGRISSPREAAARIAAAANAPVYGPLDGFIGVGVVGGRVPSFEAMGRRAGGIVNALLAGAFPSGLQLPAIEPTSLQVDWRQLRRWGIEESAIPEGTVVLFREPSLWEAHRNTAIVAALIILIQAALIATLLLERRRRRSAESSVQKQRMELAHASRLAVAGELTASIAHEINQPLGAIQTSADAADLILQSGGDRRDDLMRIVTRIRRDILRASDVIRRLRALFAKHTPERQEIDLNAAIGDALALLRVEARQRGVTLDLRLAPAYVQVIGDPTQLQQVVIILVLNAMDAIEGLPEDRRTIVVSVERLPSGAAMVVRDRGRGIAPEHADKLFDSFFSTKPRGMGLGLSIARTIVEAHGGRILADRSAGEGVAFRVELPAPGGTVAALHAVEAR